MLSLILNRSRLGAFKLVIFNWNRKLQAQELDYIKFCDQLKEVFISEYDRMSGFFFNAGERISTERLNMSKFAYPVQRAMKDNTTSSHWHQMAKERKFY